MIITFAYPLSILMHLANPKLIQNEYIESKVRYKMAFENYV